MKREDLKKLLGESATDEALNQIMAWNGADIESHKTTATDLQTKLEAATKQLGEANTAIESFKAMKPDELKAAADDYKAKFEKATQDAASQLSQIKFDHALESALMTAKAKNPKAVAALLSTDELKNSKGEFTQELFDKQLGKIKTENDYLFDGDKKPVTLVTGVQGGTQDPKPTFAAAIKERLTIQAQSQGK